ncbi:hypothetical protein Hanom_Chr09g00840241 [Helianthus anomalus]
MLCYCRGNEQLRDHYVKTELFTAELMVSVKPFTRQRRLIRRRQSKKRKLSKFCLHSRYGSVSLISSRFIRYLFDFMYVFIHFLFIPQITIVLHEEKEKNVHPLSCIIYNQPK